MFYDPGCNTCKALLHVLNKARDNRLIAISANNESDKEKWNGEISKLEIAIDDRSNAHKRDLRAAQVSI